jgi:hypothetical protein
MDYLNMFLSGLSALGATSATFVACLALRLSRKQFNLEQEPNVVVFDDITKEDRGFRIKIKNDGRGQALSILGCLSPQPEKRNDGFFSSDQPHSKSLYPGDRSSWLIDSSRIEEFTDIDEAGLKYSIFYLFYESQLGKTYRTNIKLKEISSTRFVIMSCNREPIEGSKRS